MLYIQMRMVLGYNGITKEERERAWQRVHDDLIGAGPQLRTVLAKKEIVLVQRK